MQNIVHFREGAAERLQTVYKLLDNLFWCLLTRKTAGDGFSKKTRWWLFFESPFEPFDEISGHQNELSSGL
jgi:hypothetical protein